MNRTNNRIGVNDNFIVQPLEVNAKDVELSAVAKAMLQSGSNRVYNKMLVKNMPGGLPLTLEAINYRDVKLITRFLSVAGNILPRRKTGLNISEQNALREAVKRARMLALIPYSNQKKANKN